jgi:hypothetical protein
MGADLVAGCDRTAFAHKGQDGAAKRLELGDDIAARPGLDEPPASVEPNPSVDRPVEDAGQLGDKTIGKTGVFFAVKGPRSPSE